MRRLLLFSVILAVAGSGSLVAGQAAASAPPARAIAVAGPGVGMYPAFDPAISRYAATTTSATGGTLEIAATTSDPDGLVRVNGAPATTPTTVVSGLSEGDEVSVIIEDGGGTTAYSVVYLPAGFPAMTATTTGPVQDGYIGVGLTTFASGPSFEALLDRNGVPAWVRTGIGNDFKRQPNGELTVMRPTTAAGHTGTDLVVLDEEFQEQHRLRVGNGLTDTDNHDAQRLADGSTILIGYEPNGEYLDATIQKLDPDGEVVFQWDSSGLEAETLNPLLWPQGAPNARIDYAHINSVEEIPDGTGDLLVSFRHFSAVFRITTEARDGLGKGAVVWRLGGRESDFTFLSDPHHGPCAQHTATWTGPNRVLLFDNGSATLGQSLAGCVDPADPDGPGKQRALTRVTEYQLDPEAGTATLVWSYVPGNTFSFFAGSSFRLANGNTLVGWASDRTTLATEVNAAPVPEPVWSLSVPDNTTSTGYTSYRVSLVEHTDEIEPAVTVDLPEGAVYVEGRTPAPRWTCTDRGGSNLAGCDVDGLVDGHLADEAGTHTLAIRAADGAGNTTTVTRHYTVLSGPRPDGLIRKMGGAWRGGDAYGSASDQSIRHRARRGQKVSSQWLVQNDGESAGRLRLAGTPSNARWRVRYFAGGKDVTRAVSAGTYRTTALAPGQRVSLRVEATPTRRPRPGSARTLILRATSTHAVASSDAVAVRLQVRR
ncbi:MAG TPA: aryl-sulfate sulfotransferase [Nocardioides sp.]|nr:aryl-sulfate sulfotransferase [Nocardioides sp.]